MFSYFGKSLSLIQPEGLHLPSLLAEAGPHSLWDSEKKEHKLAYIVHAIVEGGVRNSRQERPGFYVPLSAKNLERYIGAAYVRPALDTLKALGVIEENSRYSAGRFSKSYRLTDTFRSSPLVWREIANATLARRVGSIQAAANVEAVSSSPVRKAILANLDSLSLAPEGENLVAGPAQQAPEARAAWRVTAHDIKAKRFWINHDQNTGRVFHNITQCPRELRHHMLIDGQPTAEVDVSSAQPYFLLSLFPAGEEAEAERRRYADAVGSGYFYNDIFNHCENRRAWGGDWRAWRVPGNSHRERFKVNFLAMALYSKPSVRRSKSQAVKAFTSLYPYLASDLELRLAPPSGPSDLARELQRQEAGLMLGRVFPRILSKLPQCKPISIHDGILCQAQWAESVRGIVIEEAQKIFGVAPSVKVKGSPSDQTALKAV